jgi:hypothetical protein
VSPYPDREIPERKPMSLKFFLTYSSLWSICQSNDVDGSHDHAFKGTFPWILSLNLPQYIAWVSLFISLSAFFRDRPSVSNKTGKSAWLSIMISISSLIVAYMCFIPLTCLSNPQDNVTASVPTRSLPGTQWQNWSRRPHACWNRHCIEWKDHGYTVISPMHIMIRSKVICSITDPFIAFDEDGTTYCPVAALLRTSFISLNHPPWLNHTLSRHGIDYYCLKL